MHPAYLVKDPVPIGGTTAASWLPHCSGLARRLTLSSCPPDVFWEFDEPERAEKLQRALSRDVEAMLARRDPKLNRVTRRNTAGNQAQNFSYHNHSADLLRGRAPTD